MILEWSRRSVAGWLSCGRLSLALVGASLAFRIASYWLLGPLPLLWLSMGPVWLGLSLLQNAEVLLRRPVSFELFLESELQLLLVGVVVSKVGSGVVGLPLRTCVHSGVTVASLVDSVLQWSLFVVALRHYC